jgi:hypothetical protein
MTPPGAYKVASRNRSFESYLDPSVRSARRIARIVRSLREQIAAGDGECVRIRCVLRDPREIYRLELDLPEIGVSRITLLDRDALEELLAHDDVRMRVHASGLAGGPAARAPR